MHCFRRTRFGRTIGTRARENTRNNRFRELIVYQGGTSGGKDKLDVVGRDACRASRCTFRQLGNPFGTQVFASHPYEWFAFIEDSIAGFLTEPPLSKCFSDPGDENGGESMH
jgi:hypothetical protein